MTNDTLVEQGCQYFQTNREDRFQDSLRSVFEPVTL